MDSITHVALGAIIGEAIAGKSLGKRAMFLGAIAQSIPDIDFLAAFWLPATDNLLVHRGFTHSFLFGIIVTIILAVIFERWHRPQKIPLSTWFFFWGGEIFIHLLLDACNAYGVGWFEPFAHQRISFHILFVADPFFSVWGGIALLMLMTLGSKSTLRRFWIYFGLGLTSVYFIYAIINKTIIHRETERTLANQHIAYKRFFATPTPFNNWLWYVIVENDSGFLITNRSVFDDRPDFKFNYFPQQKSLLAGIQDQEDVQQLLRFSQGYYTIEQLSDTLVFNDLRFGQIAGWHDPKAKFVFHYYLNYPEANLLVIQRGRFSNWNRKTFRSMIKRIKGN